MAEQEVGFDVMVHKVLHMAVKRRWWLLVPMVVGGLIGCAASTVIPNTFSSEATILVAHQRVSERYVTPNDTSDLRETLLLVTDSILSRTQLLQIIKDFDLYPRKRNRLAPEDLVELMRSDITIAPLEQKTPDEKVVSSFKISFSALDPHVAQEVTNRLTTLFIQGDLQSRVTRSEETTEFLDEKLQAAAENLKQQETRVRDFKLQYLGQLPEQQQANVNILSGLHAQLLSAESVLSHAREQQVYLGLLMSQYRSLKAAGVTVPGGAPNPTPTDAARAELTRLESERQDLLARGDTDQYPDVAKLNEQIKEAEVQLAASSKAAAAPRKDDAARAMPTSSDANATDAAFAQYRSQMEANRTEIENAKAEEKSLQTQIADYTTRLNMTPVREQQLADLLRNYDLSKKNYDDLLSKKTQSELATDLDRRQEGQQFRLIDPASLPVKPSSSMHLQLALGGLAAGLGLGVGIVFLLETIDHSLLDEKDLTRHFSFPLMIGLPALPTVAETRRRSRLHILEWLAAMTLCLVVCATEFYVYHRG